MRNIIPFPDVSGIAEAAAQWLIKLDQGPLDRAQRGELEAWLNADSRHRDSIAHLARIWGQMDALNLLAQLFPLDAEPQSDPSPSRWRRHALFGCIGAAACAALIALPLLLSLPLPLLLKQAPVVPAAGEPVELVYQTERGQQSQAALKDGSRVTLNTQSKLRVQFNDDERAVYLLSGEAHFDVAKDRSRPFVVYAGNGAVRAVGTAFSVRVDERQQVNVAVAEGVVEVVTHASAAAKIRQAPRQQHIVLKKGGTANYRESIKTAYVNEDKLAQKLAWKNGKWIFNGESLAEVIAEANRYSDRKIEIVDPAIADLRVGGYFNAGDIDALLATLEAGFNIRVRKSARAIQLSALAPAPVDVASGQAPLP